MEWLNAIHTKIAANDKFREKSEICLKSYFENYWLNGMAKCNSHKNCRKWQISRKIRNLLKNHILKIFG